MCSSRMISSILFSSTIGMPMRIQRARQLRRIMASCNVWDLGCGEGDYFKFRVVAKDYVEIMKISSSSTKDEDSFHFCGEASLDP